MATGVKPRDEEIQLSRSDLDAIKDAMKDKKFREMFAEYCEEVRDPANQALYQKEMTQLEKERGYDVTFINPKGGYVIKTSVAGDRKAFINICSNDNVGKPTCSVDHVDGRKGLNWQIPYSLIPPREDYNNKKERCVIYDVVYHPDTLRMAEQNKQFRDLVNKTAFDALKNNYNIHLDNNNCKFPRSAYKGMATPAVVRKEDPNYKPPQDDETENMPPEMMEKLFPQKSYSEPQKNVQSREEPHRKRVIDRENFAHASDKGYTIPKYSIKQQKNVDLQDFTYDRNSKQYTAIPSHLVVEVNLPLLSSTKDCILDVQERALSLKSEKPAKYKLDIALPYSVNDECGNAKFDKSKRKLIVTLPVIKKNSNDPLKVDSGVESEENSGSQSDEDHKDHLIEELSSSDVNTVEVAVMASEPEQKQESFFDTSLGYLFPSYTHNVLDETIAFTFHVKNTEPDSVKVLRKDNILYIRFCSIGSGYVPLHYGAVLKFDDHIQFENVSQEAWDNNVILQLNVAGNMPDKFQIGLNEDCLETEHFDAVHHSKVDDDSGVFELQKEPDPEPIVEVKNSGNETSIVVSTKESSSSNDDDDDDGNESEVGSQEKEVHWINCNVRNGKSILRKPLAGRSLSESSVGDVASSMDYISSDCIPEESSLKKTVRFNDVIAKQVYRYNSSIEGQKKKNQRKKSKKRTLERRKSESEAEEEILSDKKTTNVKSALKQRRDSGLADTSDAESDSKNTPQSSPSNEDLQETGKTDDSLLNIVNNSKHKKEPVIWETDTKATEKSDPKVTCDSIKHNTDLYNPDKLNKGKYLEVNFKNDLIFELDM